MRSFLEESLPGGHPWGDGHWLKVHPCRGHCLGVTLQHLPGELQPWHRAMASSQWCFCAHPLSPMGAPLSLLLPRHWDPPDRTRGGSRGTGDVGGLEGWMETRQEIKREGARG